MLEHYKLSRFNCPYVFLVVVANDRDRWPIGGGRPLNGGINTGGGIVVISSWTLNRLPNFQSTLQHELGHAFGLPHVGVYGYDMKTNESMMSYNPNHKTKGFRAGRRPGVFIPEDLRALAINDRAFADLDFDASQDVPARYSLSPKVVPLGTFKIPGQPDYRIEVKTDSGTAFNSSVDNVVTTRIKPSVGPGVTRASPWEPASRFPLKALKGRPELAFQGRPPVVPSVRENARRVRCRKNSPPPRRSVPFPRGCPTEYCR